MAVNNTDLETTDCADCADLEPRINAKNTEFQTGLQDRLDVQD